MRHFIIYIIKKYVAGKNSFLRKEKLWSRMMLRIMRYGPVYGNLKKYDDIAILWFKEMRMQKFQQFKSNHIATFHLITSMLIKLIIDGYSLRVSLTERINLDAMTA